MKRRYDYALFRGEAYVTNAMLTRGEARRMEATGWRAIRADSAEWGLSYFRGRRYVAPQRPNRSRYWAG